MNPKAKIPETGSIPTSHEIMDFDVTLELSAWMDEQLKALEVEFSQYITHSSERSNLLDAR